MLVLEEVRRFRADSLEQSALSLDARDVDIERLGDPLLRKASLDRGQDHPVFLYGREPVDPLVIRKRFIICRNQAHDFGLAQVAQDRDPKMAIEQEIMTRLTAIPRDDGWLDEANLSNGCSDLAVFWSVLKCLADNLQRFDICDRNAHGIFFEPHLHG